MGKKRGFYTRVGKKSGFYNKKGKNHGFHQKNALNWPILPKKKGKKVREITPKRVHEGE